MGPVPIALVTPMQTSHTSAQTVAVPQQVGWRHPSTWLAVMETGWSHQDCPEYHIGTVQPREDAGPCRMHTPNAMPPHKNPNMHLLVAVRVVQALSDRRSVPVSCTVQRTHMRPEVGRGLLDNGGQYFR